MKIISWLKFGSTAICVCVALSGCGFVAQQLSDKQLETQLLKPGALDAPVAEHYDTYQYRFLDRYRVTHDWLGVSNCKYGKLITAVRTNRIFPALYAVDDIFEEGGKTWQRDTPPRKPYDFDRYVRSLKETVPVMEAGKQVGTRERENGLSPLCFQYWAGSGHQLALLMQKTSIAERIKFYERKAGTSSNLTINGLNWWVRSHPYGVDLPKIYGGEVWVTAMGESGYTLTLQFGASEDALKTPKAHAQFQTIFRHLIESVKIEALTPQIQAELAQNAQKAQAIQLNDCQKIVVKEKLSPKHWCRPVLGLPYPQE